MNTTFTRKSLPLAVLLASGLAANNVTAALEEVLVTAQKREQSLQDTPIAITAFDKTAIDARGISDIQDFARFALNVQIVESPAGNLVWKEHCGWCDQYDYAIALRTVRRTVGPFSGQ